MSDGGNTVPRIANAEHIGPNDTGDNIEAKRVAGYIWNGTSWERHSGAGAALESRFDTTTTTDAVYIGKALPGSATSAAAWQIVKIDTAAGSKIYADDVTAFTKIWNDRTTYGY